MAGADGLITEEVLRLAGFLSYWSENPEAVDETVGAGCDMAFSGISRDRVTRSETC